MASFGVFSPTRKSPPYLICPFPNVSSHKVPPVPFSSIPQNSGGCKKFYKFPLSSAEEKHVDTCMLMSTTKNKTRTKYSEEVSEK